MNTNMTSTYIKNEIYRFEGVHPCIYTIYDFLDQLPDVAIAEKIREHVVSIEDAFVNSQEWTMSRSVPDIRLGVLGSALSGKSALVHRYLTGSYLQEDSPEGGRFKKEVLLDRGQSFLLLIRDEAGPPDDQFSHWVDGLIFVFSLENEESLRTIHDYYARIIRLRGTVDLPIILVGTQDAISESNPRLIDDARARQTAADMRRCPYYETCATYGLNVERVFQDACMKIVKSRTLSSSSTSALVTTSSSSVGTGQGCQGSSGGGRAPSPPPPPPPPVPHSRPPAAAAVAAVAAAAAAAAAASASSGCAVTMPGMAQQQQPSPPFPSNQPMKTGTTQPPANPLPAVPTSSSGPGQQQQQSVSASMSTTVGPQFGRKSGNSFSLRFKQPNASSSQMVHAWVW